jgi:hypothetical protein
VPIPPYQFFQITQQVHVFICVDGDHYFKKEGECSVPVHAFYQQLLLLTACTAQNLWAWQTLCSTPLFTCTDLMQYGIYIYLLNVSAQVKWPSDNHSKVFERVTIPKSITNIYSVSYFSSLSKSILFQFSEHIKSIFPTIEGESKHLLML